MIVEAIFIPGKAYLYCKKIKIKIKLRAIRNYKDNQFQYKTDGMNQDDQYKRF
jgi:hypothetical protein